MATYRPLAGSARAVQEPLLLQQQRQQSDAGDRFNGNGGVRKEWWWQPGPVDSCCCCCYLRAGVGVLAMDALLTGIWTIFYFRTFYIFMLEALREVIHDQHTIHCSGSAITTPSCESLNESRRQAEGLNNVILHLPASVYVQAVLGVLAGVIGLWAVFFRSRRAAKIYMLSWPARAVVSVWMALEMRSLYIKYGADQGHSGIIHFISFIFCIYYFKVSWSYYKQRDAHDKAQADSINAPLDTDDDGTPMLAMNTIV